MAGPWREIAVWGAQRVGDVVMTFPALKLLRAHAPGVRITFVTTDYAEDIARLSGLADEVIAFRFKKTLPNLPAYRRLRRDVKQGRFDRIFLSAKTTLYRRRIGPVKEGLCVCTKETGHRAERLARAVLKELGIEGASIPPACLDIADRPEAAETFAGLGLDILRDPYVVMHPGCNRTGRGAVSRWGLPERLWPPPCYVKLIDMLAERCPGVKVAVVGTQNERPWVTEQVELEARHAHHLVNLCGRTQLAELLQLLKHTRALVACDSGVMHMGTVVDAPMVLLFGPSDETVTGPFGASRACVLRGLPLAQAIATPDCMLKISVRQVFDKVQERLAGAG